MMQFGNSKRFAIEVELDPDPDGVWMNGSVCYWLYGSRIGDWGFSTSLRDVLFRWERIAYDKGKRENDFLFSMDTKTLVNTLHDAMYEEEGPIFQRAIDEEWATHLIRPIVDVFDDWYVFLVEGNGIGRFVYHHTVTEVYGEGMLDYGEFDRVLSEAINYLNQCFEELSDGVKASEM